MRTGIQTALIFQNHLYFKLAQNSTFINGYLRTLYGASPVSEDMPHSIPEDLELPVRVCVAVLVIMGMITLPMNKLPILHTTSILQN